MKFFVGLHQPSDAQHFTRCMVSVNRLITRKSDFPVSDWIMDSGAFSQIYRTGEHLPMEQYATQVIRWSRCGSMVAAVTQDYMCEPFILAKTGLTVAEHQRKTVERYVELRNLIPESIYLMPVIQGYTPQEYVDHIKQYGDLLVQGMWVGVGSVCKRNSNPGQVCDVLYAIKKERPDLRLHGFGLKKTALECPEVQALLYSSDSMAWSFATRKQGKGANDWHNAKTFEEGIARVLARQRQTTLVEYGECEA